MEEGEQTRYVESVHCHQENCKAKGNPRLNDIALIRLDEPVQMRYRSFTHTGVHWNDLSKTVDTASIPEPFAMPIMSQDCITLGWGDTKNTGHADVLKQVSIPLVSNEQCNDFNWRGCTIRSCMMCAGAYGRAPCAVSIDLNFAKWRFLFRAIPEDHFSVRGTTGHTTFTASTLSAAVEPKSGNQLFSRESQTTGNGLNRPCRNSVISFSSKVLFLFSKVQIHFDFLYSRLLLFILYCSCLTSIRFIDLFLIILINCWSKLQNLFVQDFVIFTEISFFVRFEHFSFLHFDAIHLRKFCVNFSKWFALRLRSKFPQEHS